MAFEFPYLNATIRAYMLAEFQKDTEQERIFLSPRLTEIGKNIYPTLLRDACEKGNMDSFKIALSQPNILKNKEDRKLKNNKTISVNIPHNAAEQLAEGEFNKLYIRALCMISFENKWQVEVFRARHSKQPRISSEEKIGLLLDPEELLEVLRNQEGFENSLGIPAGINSGLSIRFHNIDDSYWNVAQF
jgi:hypothetical protein